MNGEATVLDTIRDGASLHELQDELEGDYAKKSGVQPSSHTGGCGGVNGAVEDNKFINSSSVPTNVAKALITHPALAPLWGIEYGEELGNNLSNAVKETAGKTAQFLEQSGWNGPDAVERIKAKEPIGVEELQVDPADEKFHGHKENSLALVFSVSGKNTLTEEKMAELGLGDNFVVNLDASLDMAKYQSGNRGNEGVVRNLIANLAKHAAVGKRLPHEDTPAYIVIIP